SKPLLVDEQDAVEDAVLPHEVFGGTDFFLTLLLAVGLVFAPDLPCQRAEGHDAERRRRGEKLPTPGLHESLPRLPSPGRVARPPAPPRRCGRLPSTSSKCVAAPRRTRCLKGGRRRSPCPARRTACTAGRGSRPAVSDRLSFRRRVQDVPVVPCGG